MRSSISAFLIRIDIRIVLEEITLAFGAITVFFHKEGTMASLCEATASTMDYGTTMDCQ